MSKGPGKWQRMILAKLGSEEAFLLRGMLPEKCEKKVYNALLRAAWKLQSDRKIEISHSGGGLCFPNRTYAHRIGTPYPAARVNADRKTRDARMLAKWMPSLASGTGTHLTIDADFSTLEATG